MSAHHHPHSSEKTGSFWPVVNVFLAIALGGFALLFAGALMLGAIKQSAGIKTTEAPAPATAAAPAADAAPAAAATPATAPTAVAEVTIKPDSTQPMAYDTKEFTVKAGQKVKLTFNNTHPAVPHPHNLVIGKAGAKDKLMAAAMQIMTDPNGMAKGYIPESPEVLFHTKLLQPNSSETLEFTAPAAGAYPFLCTFPGHGALMNGVMKVE